MSYPVEVIFEPEELREMDSYLRNLHMLAAAALDSDTEYWSALACGQDTEEAEASGALAGQIAGLEAAGYVLRGQIGAAYGCLDLQRRQIEEVAT